MTDTNTGNTGDTGSADISDCCKMIDPCDAVCMLNNVLIDLAMGKSVTHYKVGGESFSFARPSVSDVKGLLQHFEEQCNKAQGKPTRSRAKVCLVFGNHECGRCHQSSCRCR